MKRILMFLATVGVLAAGAMERIVLPPVARQGGKPTMEALWNRRSDRAFSERELALDEIAGLLWAANGYNRPDRRTNATGMNKQEIVVYLCRGDGAYRYDAKAHALEPVCAIDLRPALAVQQEFVKTAPAVLLVAADTTDPVYSSDAWGTMSHYDAGIVSGNIYLYCSAKGLATVCRGTMDRAAIRKALGLSDKVILHLNHPVGYRE